MLSRLAPIREIDDVLVDLTWAIARLAGELPFAEGSQQIRYLSSKPLLQDDGTVVRILIRVLVRDQSTVELLTVEAIEEPSAL